MIQALPQKNNPKHFAPKMQNQASSSNKRIFQAACSSAVPGYSSFDPAKNNPTLR
jgi:hypothetical protein